MSKVWMSTPAVVFTAHWAQPVLLRWLCKCLQVVFGISVITEHSSILKESLFLQPIQTKIKIKIKKPLWLYWFCRSMIVHERCTGYNLASWAMWTSKSSIYKRPMVLSEPVYMRSWSPKKNCFELIWAFQTQTTLWRWSGSGNALLPTTPNIWQAL